MSVIVVLILSLPFSCRFLLSFWPELSSVRMKKGLHLDDLKRSTPWLVDDHLQAERAVRRCRCDVCLGRIVV